jgi:hypothetical protein
MKEYYTYAYLREDKTPYYIGKGKKNRAFDRKKHTTFVPSKNRILILKQNLTEEEAFRHEIYMIDVFGRKDLGNGILHNLTDGGEGGSGYSHTEENKEYIKQIQLKRWNEEEKNKITGKNNPFYGKTHSEENKIKIGIKSKERNQGFNNPRSKNWEIVFDNGKTVIINCMSIWCKNNGYNYSSIINVYRKLSKNHRGIVLVNQL